MCLIICHEPAVMVGTTCASVPPANQQDCINTFVNKWMVQVNGNMPGSTCGSRPPMFQQQCINDFVIQQQRKASPGTVGGCAGVSPQYKQQCVNNYVMEVQAQQAKPGPKPTPKPTPKPSKLTNVINDSALVLTCRDN